MSILSKILRAGVGIAALAAASLPAVQASAAQAKKMR